MQLIVIKSTSNVIAVCVECFVGTEKADLGTISVQMGKTYKYEWYDCRTGNLITIESIKANANTLPIVTNNNTGLPSSKPTAENAVTGVSNYNDMLLVVSLQ